MHFDSSYLSCKIFFQKKGGNVKTIPPYKPIPADNGSSDSSPEKEAEIPMKSSGSKRKSSSSKSTTSNSKNKTTASPNLELNGSVEDRSDGSTPKDGSGNAPKFTTSNFVETIVTQSESVFGHDGINPPPSPQAMMNNVIKTSGAGVASISASVVHKITGQPKSNSGLPGKSSTHTSKKRKGARTPTVIANDNSNNSVNSEHGGSVLIPVSSVVSGAMGNNGIQPTITEATSLTTNTNVNESDKLKKVPSALKITPYENT